MNLCRTARALLDLAIDAVEATLYAVFDFDRVADEIWADAGANRLADKEAEEEVAEAPMWSVGFVDGYPYTIPCSSSPASASVGDDQPGGSVPTQDVEPPGLQLTRNDIFSAVVAARARAHSCSSDLAAIPWHQLADKLAIVGRSMQ